MGTKDKENEYPNKPKLKEYNTNLMLTTARSFLMAAKRCNEPPLEQMGWSHPLLVPIVTNIAFSCELFLKTILNEYDLSPKHEHNLLKLFEALPKEAKNNIIGSNDNQDFILKLKQNSYLFKEWRYIYEHHLRSINISFLFDFAERLSCYAEQFFLVPN